MNDMLTVEIDMYDENAGGRSMPIGDIGYSCDCTIDPAESAACACRINFYGRYPILPGESRRADIFFLTGDDAETRFAGAQQFFLSENGAIVGRAHVRSSSLQLIRP
jgi:hypothetical protein